MITQKTYQRETGFNPCQKNNLALSIIATLNLPPFLFTLLSSTLDNIAGNTSSVNELQF